ncbi:type I restriction enzyme, S subunit [Candidatus Methanomarinus sp.]|nr:type I restriction enzyme, S subunit [ANME-2 cluster archaeon]
MIKKTFFENFELLADAPNGVQKLRELILNMAIQGKLLPQNLDDKSVYVLLEEIKSEKNQLIQKRKLKLRKISESDDIKILKYKIPSNWCWFILPEVVFFQEGPGIRNWQFKSHGIKLLNVQNILPNSKVFFENSDKYVSEEEVNEKYAHFLIEDGDLLFAASGGSWGKSAWFNNPGYKIMLNTSTIRLRFFSDEFEQNYLKYFLDSSYFKKQMELQLVGMQPNFGSTHLSRVYIPIPPLEEQKRIVNKVYRLMALCDELEACQQKKYEQRIHLNNAALDKLLTAPTPEEFAQHWQRICDNFNLLYDVPETVGQLRQGILQMAVQGKLVTQDEGDEPASVLLEMINTEKDRLLREKKIKNQKQLPLIEPEELPFNIPKSWKWVRLGEVVDYNGALKVSPNKIPDDSWLLELEDIEKDTSKIIKRVLFRVRKSKSTKTKFENDDVLYGKLRPYLNKVVLADDDGFCTTEIIPLHGYFGIFPKYLMYSLKRPDFLTYVNSKTYGINLPRLGTEDARSALFPLPPLEEQKRIVAKVDQFMALCGELEAGLTQAQKDGGKLMEAVVGKLVDA